MTQAILEHLLDAGCSETNAVMIEQLYQSGQLLDAIHQMKVVRCDLLEDLHQRQRRIDCLDVLIRNTEKEQKHTKQEE